MSGIVADIEAKTYVAKKTTPKNGTKKKSNKMKNQSRIVEDENKKFGQIPLHFAACNNNVKACEALLDQSDKNIIYITDNKGWNSLHSAVEFGEK